MRPAVLVLAGLLVLAAPAAARSLTAGDIDDNLNWNAYTIYQARNAPVVREYAPSLADRITVLVRDAEGRPFPNLPVTVAGEQGSVLLRTGSDGVLRIFPAFDGLGTQPLTLLVDGQEPLALEAQVLGANRVVAVTLDRTAPAVTQVDLQFTVDTTGSMGDELSYLRDEVIDIVARVREAHPQADLRFGLVLYRDVTDEYVVRDLGFTSDIEEFQGWVADQVSDGGGDFPEAMERALAKAAGSEWRDGASKLLFLVADAPPHTEDLPAFFTAVGAARAEGVRIHSLAASGVEDNAQAAMRAASAATQGRYAWLTDDSGIGNSHAEPTVPCYIVTELKHLIVRIVASEMVGKRVEPTDDQVLREVGDYEDGVCYAIRPRPVQTVPPVPSQLPAPTAPVPTDPVHTDPVPTDPVPTGPLPTVPVPTFPVVTPSPTLPVLPSPTLPVLPSPTLPVLPSPTLPVTPSPTLPVLPSPTATPTVTLPVLPTLSLAPPTTMPVYNTMAPTLPGGTVAVSGATYPAPPMERAAALAWSAPAAGGGGGGSGSAAPVLDARSYGASGSYAVAGRDRSSLSDGDGYADASVIGAGTESVVFSEATGEGGLYRFDSGDSFVSGSLGSGKATLDSTHDAEREAAARAYDPFDHALPQRGDPVDSPMPAAFAAAQPANPYTGMVILAGLGVGVFLMRRKA